MVLNTVSVIISVVMVGLYAEVPNKKFFGWHLLSRPEKKAQVSSMLKASETESIDDKQPRVEANNIESITNGQHDNDGTESSRQDGNGLEMTTEIANANRLMEWRVLLKSIDKLFIVLFVVAILLFYLIGAGIVVVQSREPSF